MKRKASSTPAFGKRSRRPARRMRRKFRSGKGRFARMVRGAVLRNTETKFAVTSHENRQLYHNIGEGASGGFTWLNNLLVTSVGTTQTSRIGDAVYGRYLKMKLWISNKLDRPNVMYRIAILSVPPDQLTSNPSGLFRGEHGNKMIDSFNTDRYKVIWHKLIQPKAGDYSLETGATNKERSLYVPITISLKNREIRYSTDSGTVPSLQRNCLSLCLIAYDAFATLTTDNIASFSVLSKFYFKDP